MARADAYGSGDARLQRSLVTPEGVDLNLRIADAGQRIGAFVIDVALQTIVLILFYIIVGLAIAAMGLDNAEPAVIVWLLGGFLLRSFWFVGFELTARAATPGKRLLGLRVASRDGGRLTAEAVLTRNALREVELWLPLMGLGMALNTPGGAGSGLPFLILAWTAIFLLFPLFNRDRLRAGDLVAGTWVVQNPKRRLLHDITDSLSNSQFAFTPAQLAAYGVKELHVLEDVLRGQDRATMKAVAERIRRKIDWQPDGYETDREFLTAYYSALRARLEQRMLFGHRRKDKHDKA